MPTVPVVEPTDPFGPVSIVSELYGAAISSCAGALAQAAQKAWHGATTLRDWLATGVDDIAVAVANEVSSQRQAGYQDLVTLKNALYEWGYGLAEGFVRITKGLEKIAAGKVDAGIADFFIGL